MTIKPDSRSKEWVVEVGDVEGDRAAIDVPVPHSLGFMYFPRRYRDARAFAILRADMLGRHDREITSLNRSRDQLLDLKLPKIIRQPLQKTRRQA